MRVMYRTLLYSVILLAANSVVQRPALAQDPADAAAPSVTARMLEELSAAYASLAGFLGDNPAEAVSWAEEDVENFGDWEYRIVELDDSAFAEIEAALNALGNERWEVYWVAAGNGNTRFFLKRPALSYLSRVPLSALLRMLTSVGQ